MDYTCTRPRACIVHTPEIAIVVYSEDTARFSFLTDEDCDRLKEEKPLYNYYIHIYI